MLIKIQALNVNVCFKRTYTKNVPIFNIIKWLSMEYVGGECKWEIPNKVNKTNQPTKKKNESFVAQSSDDGVL